ncbi:MAG: metal ABC transporter permease, partial [Acidimicrobiia bacterium]
VPKVAHGAMLALVTVVVVTSFRTVGSLLVFGLMVAPPATAALVARRVPTVMFTALGFGALAVIGGLLISYHLATAASATIAFVAVGMFFLVLAVVSVKR